MAKLINSVSKLDTKKKECIIGYLNGKTKAIKYNEITNITTADGHRFIRIYYWPTGSALTSDREESAELYLD